MNLIFHDLISSNMEILIYYSIEKLVDFNHHLANLEWAFHCTRKCVLELNMAKCAFGNMVGNFLSFMVHSCDIKVEKIKAKAILQASLPLVTNWNFKV